MTIARVLVIVAATVAPASAQPAPPADLPRDYLIAGYLDRAVVSDGRALLQGWVFECRSGLQPVSQRVGSVSVHYAAPGREPFIPRTIALAAGERPDVAAVYQPFCPSVGNRTGYAIVTEAPPAGTWTARVAWVTFDGRDRQTPPHESSATITVR